MTTEIMTTTMTTANYQSNWTDEIWGIHMDGGIDEGASVRILRRTHDGASGGGAKRGGREPGVGDTTKHMIPKSATTKKSGERRGQVPEKRGGAEREGGRVYMFMVVIWCASAYMAR